MSTTTLTQLKAKSATLIKSADDKLASATSSVAKIEKKLSRTEEKHTEMDAGIQSLGTSQQDLKAAILFPDIYIAAKQQPELALTVRVLKYRLAEEMQEKERFKTKFAEASTASTREKREKKSLIKAMADMHLIMDAMQVKNIELQLHLDTARHQRAEMALELEEHYEASEERHARRQADNDEQVEQLQDFIKFLQSAKGATSTQAALDKLEVESAAGLWSN